MHKKMYLTECIVHRYVGGQTQRENKSRKRRFSFTYLLFKEFSQQGHD